MLGMSHYIFYLPILHAIVHPRVSHRVNPLHVFLKHQRILLPSDIRITHEIAICPVSDPTAVLSIVEDDVVPHVEEPLSGNLGTSLVVAVENVVMDGDIGDWS
jgi:hypothetical protein